MQINKHVSFRPSCTRCFWPDSRNQYWKWLALPFDTVNCAFPDRKTKSNTNKTQTWTTVINHTEWQKLLRIRFSFVFGQFSMFLLCHIFWVVYDSSYLKKSLQRLRSLKNPEMNTSAAYVKSYRMINSFGIIIEFYRKWQKIPMLIGQEMVIFKQNFKNAQQNMAMETEMFYNMFHKNHITQSVLSHVKQWKWSEQGRAVYICFSLFILQFHFLCVAVVIFSVVVHRNKRNQ